MEARGYAAPATKELLTPFTFQRRAVGPHDVLIEIQFSGICHSDIHSVRGEWGQGMFPMVPGHEIVGVAKKVGEKVTMIKVGEPVGVGCFVDTCRSCECCKKDLDSYCNKKVLTYNSKFPDGTLTYGGYSDIIVVDENYVLRLPKNLPLDATAPLLCAGITMFSPLKHWNAGPGKKVAIMGLGGLGHIAVKIARAMGAEVTVLSQSMKKKDDAIKLGAHHYYATSEAATFEALKGKFDLILNTVSVDLDANLYMNLLAVDGSFVFLGVPEKQDVNLKVGALVFMRKTVSGSLIGGIKETQEMLDFCGKHNIVCDIELIPIQKVNEAYDRVVKSDVRYRFVIDMKTLPSKGS
jgi:uncharacterized zinc-type alcohol dehydrogenase-like protein